jgi:hypothetical protein
MLLAAVVLVLLALAGIVIATLRRRRQSVQRNDSLRLPAMPWNQPGLRRQRGRSRHPRNRRSVPDDALQDVPPEAEASPGLLEPETDDGDARPGASETTTEEDDGVVVQTAADLDGDQTSASDTPPPDDENDDAEASEPSSDEAPDFSTPPSDASDGEDSQEIGGDRRGEESEADPADVDAEVAATPTLFAERERVIVQLADGRSLEGWKRVSGAANESLLILDVITAFDSEGNHAPTTRADSFILRSEITSITRIDDS